MRIALSADLGCYAVDADVAANTRAAADRLRDAGATVEEVALPWDLEDHQAGGPDPLRHDLRAVDAGDLRQARRRAHLLRAALGRGVRPGLQGRLRGRAWRWRRRSTPRSGELLEEFDALICPTFAVPALPAEYDTGQPVHGERPGAASDWLDVMMTLPFNIASRCPVLSVPSGLSRDGVPTGLSIVGKTYDDVTVFRIAAAHEERMPWLDTAAARRPL